MAIQITPPSANEDARELWRKVAECANVLNALQNMTIVIEGKVHMLGRLDVSSGASVLRIIEGSEISN